MTKMILLKHIWRLDYIIMLLKGKVPVITECEADLIQKTRGLIVRTVFAVIVNINELNRLIHCKKGFSYLDFLSCFLSKYLTILKPRSIL